MERLIARVISVLFHPLLMPTYLSIILLNTPSHLSFIIPVKNRYIIEGLILAISFLLPVLIVFLFKNFPSFNIKTWNMDEQDERNVPFLVSAFALYIAHKVFSSMHVPVVQLLSTFLLGSSILVVCTFIINFKWKISAHMIGIGGLVSALFIVSYFVFPFFEIVVLAIFISGIIAYARLKMESHNPAQVYVGYLLGIVGMAVVLLIVL